ncbi:MAG: DnaJ domain-containing protein [Clostridia bacterium]|nr:DnaJ domain-containing protein [Clostridia bacterium]
MNPYEVLGVNPSDDEETIKKAYRNLVKKYHPDRYTNSPLKDEANEKLKEINLAYDIITGKAKPEEPQRNGGYTGYGGYNTSSFEVSFRNVRTLISMGFSDIAEQMLQNLPKNAEWYYLMGIIYRNRGWYQNAKENFETASRMEPGNTEYKYAHDSFSRHAESFDTYSTRINPDSLCYYLSNLCCRTWCFPCMCFC